MIDGSAQFLNQFAKANLGDANDEIIRSVMIQRCIQIVFPQNVNEISRKVFAENTWDAKLKTFSEIETDKNQYTASYLRKMLDGLFKRIKIALNADKIELPVLEFTSISLIKPKLAYSFPLDVDYGLEKYASETVKVTTIDGNHATILKNLELPRLLNK